MVFSEQVKEARWDPWGEIFWSDLQSRSDISGTNDDLLPLHYENVISPDASTLYVRTPQADTTARKQLTDLQQEKQLGLLCTI